MPRQERERRYISEYMLDTWPEGNWQLNVELGPIPDDYVKRHGLSKAAALFRPTRPRVDAVRWSDDAYYLIEAKIREVRNGISDLIYYRSQSKAAPDLPYFDGQPIKCRLVVPWMIDWIMVAAVDNDIEVAIFEPDWIADYVEERKHYFTAEYRAARAEKMELRKFLDVE